MTVFAFGRGEAGVEMGAGPGMLGSDKADEKEERRGRILLNATESRDAVLADAVVVVGSPSERCCDMTPLTLLSTLRHGAKLKPPTLQ